MLQAAELLRDLPDVLFLLVGDGAERSHLVKQRDMMRLDNVVMLAPPYVLSDEEADLVAGTVERAIHEELPKNA